MLKVLSLETVSNSITFTYSITGDGVVTFIDGLYDHLKQHGSEALVVTTFNLLQNEEYDTDAMGIDLVLYKNLRQCNIMKLMKSKQKFQAIYDYFYEQKCVLYLLRILMTQMIDLYNYMINSETVYI